MRKDIPGQHETSHPYVKSSNLVVVLQQEGEEEGGRKSRLLYKRLLRVTFKGEGAKGEEQEKNVGMVQSNDASLKPNPVCFFFSFLTASPFLFVMYSCVAEYETSASLTDRGMEGWRDTGRGGNEKVRKNHTLSPHHTTPHTSTYHLLHYQKNKKKKERRKHAK